MGIYALANGEVIDTTTAVQMWRGEYRDTCLYLFPDGRYVVFIWEAGTAYEVKSLEQAKSVHRRLVRYASLNTGQTASPAI